MAELLIFSQVDAHAELERLRTKSLNFNLDDLEHITNDEWRIDDYRQALASERPGPPEHDGSWDIARRLAEGYEFVDPSVVRAFYDPQEPPEDRNMLLEVDFWGLRIYAGVRSGGIADEPRGEGGRAARVWAWSYRTLEGHFEAGQIDYEVWKWLDSGEVEFRIHSVSRAAKIRNLIVRLGFLAFGRHKQIEFAHKACARMAGLTSSVLSGNRALEPAVAVDAHLVIQPLPGKRTAIERTVHRVRSIAHR